MIVKEHGLQHNYLVLVLNDAFMPKEIHYFEDFSEAAKYQEEKKLLCHPAFVRFFQKLDIC